MSTNWDGKNRAVAPDALFGRGYDVRTTAQQANESGSNAYLIDTADNTHIKLTITAIETELSLAGSKGQSPLQQDFYPRNFQQPSFTIMVQARSQQDVGRASEFIHKAQRNAVSRGSLMELIVPSGGLKHTQASSVRGTDGMRGVRRGMSMGGYIKSMPRTHRRHDPAPLYSFEFVVARMYSGIFEDQPYKVYKLAKWSEIVDTQLEGNFISPPQSVEQEDQAEAVHEGVQRTGVGDFFGDLFKGD